MPALQRPSRSCKRRQKGVENGVLMFETGIIERAFELARSGRFKKVDEIQRALKREGYGRADGHLSGRLIRTQLRRACDEAAQRPANAGYVEN